MHGDSGMVKTNSRSLVYTVIHPPFPQQLVQDTSRETNATKNPMSNIRSCMHVPKPRKVTYQMGHTINGEMKILLILVIKELK